MGRAGLVIAITSAWCFAFSGPMAKFLGAAGLAPLEAVWVRMGGAGVLLVAVLALVRPRALRIPRSRLLFVAAYAVVAVAGVQALFFQAITRLPVGVTLLIEYTSPVLVVLWVRFVRRVRLPRSAFIGALIAVVGLAIVVEVWQGLTLDALGLLLAVAAAACCAGYFLLSDAFGAEMDPLGLIAWGLLGAAVVLAPLSRPWAIDWQAFAGTATAGGHTLPVLAAALWLIVVATVIAYVTGVTAVRRLSAAVGATVASIEVIAGAVIAWVLLGEALGPYQIVGGLIVIAGALLAQTATAAASRHAEPLEAPTPVPSRS
ncbi:drug/metabolite transporter (DMT)-like permease [Thermocatellispora tengchongensis]|uniref:Drug/metabolite transporter (DMT)-like permease n=1 Tax=Thermocatellispora tengchongensis TaxID=1073253 RepID=A0A840NYF4_9ACTN|nr:DMT family transporter [Thermocatellispora tengchongensis]MBB5133924.1 drug/metabolite transporter (DMT)-like permease [Thermocatellispora tengchongensis]